MNAILLYNISEVVVMAKTMVSSGAQQTQMNTRIDASLKERGDVARARLGYTPSRAVRGFWQFVVDHEDDAAAIREVIEPVSVQTLSDEAARKVAATAELRALYRQTAQKLGISSMQDDVLPSWDDLREAWYDERLTEEA